jgi:hypothetical protein
MTQTFRRFSLRTTKVIPQANKGMFFFFLILFYTNLPKWIHLQKQFCTSVCPRSLHYCSCWQEGPKASAAAYHSAFLRLLERSRTTRAIQGRGFFCGVALCTAACTQICPEYTLDLRYVCLFCISRPLSEDLSFLQAISSFLTVSLLFAVRCD